MNPIDALLDAFALAARELPALKKRVWVERSDIVTPDEMPGLLILPGAVSPVDLGDDTSALAVGVRLLLYVHGERPSRLVYPLSAALHNELNFSTDLQRLVTDLPLPQIEEPSYSNNDGFSSCTLIHYTLRVVVERADPDLLA